MNEQLIMTRIAKKIKSIGLNLGFDHIGISDLDLDYAKKSYQGWIESNFQGDMSYLKKHSHLKFNPQKLVPKTLRIISARIDYFPNDINTKLALKNKDNAYISRYALGRDYHKVIRSKLKKLSEKIKNEIKDYQIEFRVFTDSAPVLEVELAEKSGLGWRGKHTLLINKDHGSWFFLGEIFINLPLPVDSKLSNHCGSCSACIDICPTKAIIAPYKLDARKCISYLTIEHKGSIPIEYRKAIGNRIYGCDDCQLICPWNKYSKVTNEHDFLIRNNLHKLSLTESFRLSKKEFEKLFNGSAILRLGYERWLRNIAIGLGNAKKSKEIIKLLKNSLPKASPMLKEHIDWAIKEQLSKN